MLTNSSTERLIIFTRYPQPGITKTRLIPLLGKQGAADFHGYLTQLTINQCLSCQPDRSFSLQVYFTGGSLDLMQSWLGKELDYEEQGEGNLGEKMTRALAQSFQSGYEKVIIIGCDCPQLTGEIIQLAFESLQEKEVVLGPAEDGGYYLIGLRRFIPQLFQLESWGTSQVLSQTQHLVKSLNLSLFLLPCLPDIDRPEDFLRYFSGRKNIF